MTTIYLGSVLLEPNRWTKDKTPTIRVSEWIGRARSAGFDGIELWENHYRRAIGGNEERQALQVSGFVAIFNTYTGFGPEDSEKRLQTSEAIRALGPRVTGVKFNVSRTASEPARLAAECRTARDWGRQLPAQVRLLCECHPGTPLETPAAAAPVFAGEWADTTRFAAIVHPFIYDVPESLRAWAESIGASRIAHIHVQVCTPEDRRVRLDQRPAQVRQTLRLLKEAGVRDASWTLEFTEGTGTPDGDVPERLWENALRDLAFLRTELDR